MGTIHKKAHGIYVFFTHFPFRYIFTDFQLYHCSHVGTQKTAYEKKTASSSALTIKEIMFKSKKQHNTEYVISHFTTGDYYAILISFACSWKIAHLILNPTLIHLIYNRYSSYDNKASFDDICFLLAYICFVFKRKQYEIHALSTYYPV